MRYTNTEGLRNALLELDLKEIVGYSIKTLQNCITDNKTFLSDLADPVFLNKQKQNASAFNTIKESLKTFIDEANLSIETEPGIENATFAMCLIRKAEDWIGLIEHTMPIILFFRDTAESFVKTAANESSKETFIEKFLSNERGVEVAKKLYESGCRKFEALNMMPDTFFEVEEKISNNSITYIVK